MLHLWKKELQRKVIEILEQYIWWNGKTKLPREFYIIIIEINSKVMKKNIYKQDLSKIVTLVKKI